MKIPIEAKPLIFMIGAALTGSSGMLFYKLYESKHWTHNHIYSTRVVGKDGNGVYDYTYTR